MMSRRTAAALLLPAGLFILAFFLWPMASIISIGIRSDPARALEVLTDGGLLGSAWFTVWQAAVSTLLTLIAGLPIAWILARFRFPGRAALRTVVTIPFVLPTVVVAMAFLSLIGPGGTIGIDLAGTVWAVLAAHLFFNMAVVVRTVGGLWGHIDPDLEHAAMTLGASRWKVFRTITLPVLRPAITAAAAIVFLFSLTSFGVVLLLGAPRLATLEVEIYRSAVHLFDLATAATLALIQLLAVTAGLLFYTSSQKRTPTQKLLPSRAVTVPPKGRQGWAVMAIALGGAAIALIPVAAIAGRALAPGGRPSLDSFRALGRIDPSVVDPASAILNSLGYAAAACAIVLVVALPAAVAVASRRGRATGWLDTAIMLPIGSSAVTLGFGFIVALDAPLDMRSWWLLVPIAHAMVAMPFVIRATVPVVRSIAPRIREAALTLGAGPRRVWRTIDLPILTPAAAGALALAFVISLGEFGATLFVARPGGQTMTLAVFRLMSRPGADNVSAAMALSLILVVVSAGAILLLEKARTPGLGSF